MAKTKIEIELDFKGQQSVSQVEEKTKSLKTQLKEMKALLASGTLDSDQFRKLSLQAGELQDQIADVNQRVKNLSSDSRRLDAITDAAQGIVGGFTAVQGVMALVGDENEEVQKTLLKVQGALAALNGLQAVANTLNKESALMTELSARGWDKLNGALKAGVIGGVAVTLGYLYQAIELLSEKTRGITEDQEKLNTVYKSAYADVDALNTQIYEMQASFDGARKGIISKKDALFEYNKNFGDTLGVAKDLNEAERLFREKTGAYIKATALRAEANALFEAAAKRGSEQVTAQFEDNASALDKFNIILQGLRDGYVTFNTDVSNAQEKGTQERVNQLNKEKKAFEDLAKVKIEEAQRIENESNITTKIGAERRKDEASKNKTAEDKALKDQMDAYKRKRDLDLENAQMERDLIASLENEGKASEEAKTKQSEFEKAYRLQLSVDRFNRQKEIDAYELQEWNKTQQAKAQIYKDTTDSIMFLGEALLGQQFKQSALGKALAISQIAVDTALAVSSLVKNSEANPANAPTSGVAGALQFAAGMVRITAAIAKAKAILTSGASPSASGGSTGGGSSSAGVGSMGSAPNTSRFVPTTTSGGQSSQRVYVLEKDITDSQGRVAKIRHNATLI
jgi:hypothetical protein